jgi:hypothetical protein
LCKRNAARAGISGEARVAIRANEGRGEQKGMPNKKGSSKKAASKKGSGKKSARKRELIDTGTNKSYVRRDEKGRFDEVDDVGRSLSQDVRKKAKTKVPAGQGDKGDQKRKK